MSNPKRKLFNKSDKKFSALIVHVEDVPFISSFEPSGFSCFGKSLGEGWTQVIPKHELDQCSIMASMG